MPRTTIMVIVACAALVSGCATTSFHEREMLQDRSMQFDEDGGLHYIQMKIDAAREGSLGGFGSAEAGGCGCQ